MASDPTTDLDALVAGYLWQRTKSAEAERDTAQARVRALVAAAQKGVDWLNDIIREARVPRSCGACGTPDASCDMDCANAAYLSRDIGALRAALTAPDAALVARERARDAVVAMLREVHERLKRAWRSDDAERKAQEIYFALTGAAKTLAALDALAASERGDG